MLNRYYRMLELEPSATKGDVKKAYRRLVKLYHPDISDHPAAEDMFIELTKAYELILDRMDRPSQWGSSSNRSARSNYKKQYERHNRKYGTARERAERKAHEPMGRVYKATYYEHPYPILKWIMVACSILTFFTPVLAYFTSNPSEIISSGVIFLFILLFMYVLAALATKQY